MLPAVSQPPDPFLPSWNVSPDDVHGYRGEHRRCRRGRARVSAEQPRVCHAVGGAEVLFGAVCVAVEA